MLKMIDTIDKDILMLSIYHFKDIGSIFILIYFCNVRSHILII